MLKCKSYVFFVRLIREFREEETRRERSGAVGASLSSRHTTIRCGDSLQNSFVHSISIKMD